MAKPSPKKNIKKPAAPSEKIKPEESKGFAFGRQNYRLLFIGLAFIVAGFLLMIGGGSDDPNAFRDDIFNFRRLTLAPILVLTGYVIEIFAIMKKPARE